MLAERRWPMVLPFHYGHVTVDSFTEIHLRLRVELGDFVATGYAAEVAAPKWFEKQPDVGIAESVDRLRLATRRAAELVPGLVGRPTTVADIADTLAARLASESGMLSTKLTPLELSFGVALVERALIDAICRKLGATFEAAVSADLFGASQFAGPEYPRWLASRGAAPGAIAVRHTVGLEDPLPPQGLVDGRPISLADTISTYGVTAFKVKFNDTPHAIDRLEAVAGILDLHLPSYRVTMDANESFHTADALAAAMDRIRGRRSLDRFMAAVAFIEQPFERSLAGTTDLRKLGIALPVIIDESDDGENAFQRARDLGYEGVSFKTCKGVLRGLRNAARAHAWGGFVSAEDLCVQPGLNLQHNLATAAALRVADCERNGHHFGPGPGWLQDAERNDFITRHADLYAESALRISRGKLSLATTVAAPGFGTLVVPEVDFS